VPNWQQRGHAVAAREKAQAQQGITDRAEFISMIPTKFDFHMSTKDVLRALYVHGNASIRKQVANIAGLRPGDQNAQIGQIQSLKPLDPIKLEADLRAFDYTCFELFPPYGERLNQWHPWSLIALQFLLVGVHCHNANRHNDAAVAIKAARKTLSDPCACVVSRWFEFGGGDD
jgi:hypothetical protein